MYRNPIPIPINATISISIKGTYWCGWDVGGEVKGRREKEERREEEGGRGGASVSMNTRVQSLCCTSGAT